MDLDQILDFSRKQIKIKITSKNISTDPIPIFFDFLKTSRAESFISEVLVDIWQEYGTLRRSYLTMDLA